MTIGGLHTAHELSDLLAAFQTQVTDLNNAELAAGATTDTTTAVWNAWLSDYSAWLNEFNAAAAAAQSAVESGQNSTGGWDVDTEETFYQKLLTTFQNGSIPSAGGFGDLQTRFRGIPGNPQANYQGRPVPQPTAPDADLNGLNTVNTLPVVGSGGLIDEVVTKAESLTGPGTGAWWLIGGGALGAVLAVGLLKRLL